VIGTLSDGFARLCVRQDPEQFDLRREQRGVVLDRTRFLVGARQGDGGL
jgi:hypothetical protein